MADAEPSNSELAWRLDRIQDMLTGLVGRPEYAADQRAVERRIDAVARDVEALRSEHARDLEAVHKRIGDQAREAVAHRQSWRTVIWTGVIPAVVVLIGILVQLWIAHSGGGGK